jgi:hypothetical protein
MTEPLLISRQRTALQELHNLIADRARIEPRIDVDYKARNEAAEKEFQQGSHQVISRFETEKESSQKEFEESQSTTAKRFAAERAAQDKELADSRQKIAAQYEADSTAAKSTFQKSRSALERNFDAQKGKAEAQLKEAEGLIAEAVQKCGQIQDDAADLLRAWKQDRDYGELPTSQPDRIYHDAFRQLQEGIKTPEALFEQLHDLRVPAFFKGSRAIVFFVVMVLLGAGVGAVLAGGKADLLFGLGLGAGSALVVAGAITVWLYTTAKSQVTQIYQPLRQSLAEMEAACDRAREQARGEHHKQVSAAKKRFDKDLKSITDRYEAKKIALKERRDTDLAQAKEKYEQAVADSTQRKDTSLRQAHEKYQKLRAEIFARYESDSHQLHERHYKTMTDSRVQREREWNELTDRWQQGLARFQNMATEVNRENSRLFPAWDNPAWQSWTPPAGVPPGLYFGDYQVDLTKIPNGLPKEERLKPSVPTQYTLPALLPFPRRCSVLLKAGEAGRAQSIEALQSLMLRYLTSLPPGKVRFTIIDPVGLGENFASFMHLADYDEALVNNRIWTDLAHVEQRLSDLTAHMENVIQMYLRNEYETIEDYNVQAGEVAEPYRILVIANFPANFSSEAARRLVSVVSSGARCGVYALIAADTTQEAPSAFNLATLEQYTINLEWKDGRFVWKDPDFEPFPLRLEAAPFAEFSTKLLHVVGQKAREAKRVEVPFEFIAPPQESWWTGDSRGGIDVALGRAGATKRQHLQLGKGTAQHALISGKTGSGKSTLLHALVTNLSLLYSPDEVELYLIDFKKGVEFKTYAAHQLPHARVVAIESDREFGLSVLQRLDAELKLRGERFREAGAQDVKSYRDGNGRAPLPRILLVVDEFQEFFLEDDKVSQDAAQLLDRLVRQGRAFGLHVLLGSQTLGGAYTLARSTIDQMAVRIALQCSEADAQLILSDDNTAARLLSRPGEAIYNDANGLVEGNNPFQVVWLPEPRRESYLDTIREMDRKRNRDVTRTQVVFEGNAPAEVAKNPLLHQLLAAPSWPAAPLAFHAWLGEPMAIKDPTEALFRRQSGSNLLLVGQQDEGARGILALALVSLAAQHTPADESNRTSGARFFVADGSPPEQPNAGYLSRLAGLLPHPVQAGGWRELPAILDELAAEVDRRQKSNEVEGPELYLFLYGLHRFRDLRKEEDDFGFNRSEETKPSPAKQLATILKEGSALGVHVLVWCDTLNNVTRAFDRQVMREFEMRVLFQMSANDSSTLIDSPVAGRLGPHRALFHSEEEGRLEKFRPYGLPPEEWLTWMKEQLGRRRVAEAVRERV